MTRIVCLLILLILTACGDAISPLSRSVKQRLFEPSSSVPYGTLLDTAPRDVVTQFDFEIFYVDVPSRQQETVMRPFATNESIRTWVAANMTSIYLQDDIIVIGTRGYGDDLAVSQRPSWIELTSLAQSDQKYVSTYRHWSNDERLETMTFECSAQINGTQLTEVCFNNQMHFENTFELSVDLIPTGTSQQWISPSLGLVKFTRLN